MTERRLEDAIGGVFETLGDLITGKTTLKKLVEDKVDQIDLAPASGEADPDLVLVTLPDGTTVQSAGKPPKQNVHPIKKP